MTYTATITSKGQLTIPAKLFRKKFKTGEIVTIKETSTGISIDSEEALLDRLQGSVKVPEQLKGIDLDEAIRIGKEKYFQEKYRNRKP